MLCACVSDPQSALSQPEEAEPEVQVLEIAVETRVENFRLIHSYPAQGVEAIETGGAGDREDRPLSLIVVDCQAVINLNRQSPAIKLDSATIDRGGVVGHNRALDRGQLRVALQSAAEGAEPPRFRHRIVIEHGHRLDTPGQGRNAGVDSRSETQPIAVAKDVEGF